MSYISLLNYVAYTSWRCVEDSITISTLTGYMRPAAVRQLLSRLARTARSMGYETPYVALCERVGSPAMSEVRWLTEWR